MARWPLAIMLLGLAVGTAGAHTKTVVFGEHRGTLTGPGEVHVRAPRPAEDHLIEALKGWSRLGR